MHHSFIVGITFGIRLTETDHFIKEGRRSNIRKCEEFVVKPAKSTIPVKKLRMKSAGASKSKSFNLNQVNLITCFNYSKVGHKAEVCRAHHNFKNRMGFNNRSSGTNGANNNFNNNRNDKMRSYEDMKCFSAGNLGYFAHDCVAVYRWLREVPADDFSNNKSVAFLCSVNSCNKTSHYNNKIKFFLDSTCWRHLVNTDKFSTKSVSLSKPHMIGVVKTEEHIALITIIMFFIRKMQPIIYFPCQL